MGSRGRGQFDDLSSDVNSSCLACFVNTVWDSVICTDKQASILFDTLLFIHIFVLNSFPKNPMDITKVKMEWSITYYYCNS